MSASAEHMTDCPGGEVAHRTCSLKLQVGRDGRVEVRCASCTGLSGHVGNVVPSQFHCLSAPGMAAPLPPPPVNCCDLLCQQYPEGTVISRSPHVVRIKEATRIAVQGVQRTEKVGFCLWGGEEWLSSEIVDWCNQQWCTRMGWNWGEQTDYPQAPLITQSKTASHLAFRGSPYEAGPPAIFTGNDGGLRPNSRHSSQGAELSLDDCHSTSKESDSGTC